MNSSNLRIYYGPEGSTTSVEVADEHQDRQHVTVPLMDVLPLLADATRSQRTWLRDFEGDEVTISMDLYEVLLAYQHFRRPSA